MEQRIKYLELFYNSMFLPMHYYKDGECIRKFPAMDSSWDLTDLFSKKLFQQKQDISYLVSGEFMYYGIVQNKENHEAVIVGPVTSIRLDQHALTKVMLEASVSLQYREEVEYFFQLTPLYSYNQFIRLLFLIHKEINGILINPHDISPEKALIQTKNIQKKHSSTMYDAKETSSFHNTYHFEQQMFQYVEDGNIAAICQLLEQSFPLNAGKIGENSLRQQKNLLIALITLLTRHSIAGGLDIETAYQLSDIYIQESEKALSIEAIQNLSTTALYDFTERVAASKIPAGMSGDIYKCIQYIFTRTNQPITVEDVAEAVGKSRSYLSRKFKSELGFNLSDFIMRRKLEEGKSLLAYTDKPISEISEYLCFSSQSYFQNVFKKKYKVTPYQYRKNSTKNINV